MIKYLFSLCLLLFCFFTNAQPVTIKLKPNAAKGEDAGIFTSYGCTLSGSSAPGEVLNNGGGGELTIIDWTFYALGCSEGTGRFLIRFADLDTLAPCGKLRKATLNLFGVNSSLSWGTSTFPGSPYLPATNEGWVERVTSSWGEYTVTWSTQPTVTSTNRVEIPYSTARWGWDTSIEVTTLVNDIFASGSNYGFSLKLQDESIYRATYFASSDHSDSTLWPELILIYDTVVDAGNDTMACIGAPFQLHAYGADTFLWSPATGLSNPNIANPVLTVTGTATYVVEGRSKGGCISHDTITVTGVTAPPVHISPADTAVCVNSTILLHATGADTFLWVPAPELSGTTSADPILTVNGDGTYIVTGTVRSGGCSASDTVTVTAIPLPAVVVAPHDTNICADVSLHLLATGAAGYTWYPATDLSSAYISNPVFNGTTGAYTFIVEGISAAGCTGYDTITINVHPLPVMVTQPDDTACIHEVIGLWTSGADAYLWTPAKDLSSPYSDHVNFTANVTTAFIIQGSTAWGCIAYDTLTITVNDPKVVAGPDTVLCPGAVVHMYASGAQKYKWSPAAGLSNSSIADPELSYTEPVQYMVTGTDQNGCIAKDTVWIGNEPQPEIVVTADKSIGCNGDTVHLFASGASAYNWFPPTGLDRADAADPLLFIVSDGITYTVTGTDSNGCSNTADITINQYPQPHVDAYADNVIIDCQQNQVMLQASGADTYTWSPAIYCDNPDSSSTNVHPPYTLVFTLDGKSSDGCTGRDTITVVYAGASAVHVPSGFSPNNDGLNDKIRAFVYCDFQLKDFVIYSRWGQQVFMTNDINIPWDGTFNGDKLDAGIFYYLIRGKNSKDETVVFKGDITLIR